MTPIRIFDISRTLEPETAVFPGDQPFSLEWTERLREGSPVNLSVVRGSPHAGTHADAHLHVRDGAEGMDEAPLSAFLGSARVVAVSPGTDGLIHPEALGRTQLAGIERLLLKTGTDPDSRRWTGRYAALSPELARLVVDAGIVLVGLDTPSMDGSDSEDLPAHHALLDGGLHWLENLDLSRVEPGEYWLSALPIKIRGADGAWVRAALFRFD